MRVEIVGLSLSRGRVRVLDDVNMVLEQGLTVLLGPNGAGKSTLMQTLVGLLHADEGDLTFTGSNGSVLGDADVRRSVGYVPQEATLPRGVRLDDLLRYVAWLQGVPSGKRHAAVAQVLGAMRLEGRAATAVHQLSGGMRQRALIAMALLHEPTLLVLDEPTVGLDPVEQQVFRQLLVEQGRRRVVLVATHLLIETQAIADHVAILAEGRVRFRGSPDDLSSTVEPREGEDRSARLERGYVRLVESAGAAR